MSNAIPLLTNTHCLIGQELSAQSTLIIKDFWFKGFNFQQKFHGRYYIVNNKKLVEWTRFVSRILVKIHNKKKYPNRIKQTQAFVILKKIQQYYLANIQQTSMAWNAETKRETKLYKIAFRESIKGRKKSFSFFLVFLRLCLQFSLMQIFYKVENFLWAKFSEWFKLLSCNNSQFFSVKFLFFHGRLKIINKTCNLLSFSFNFVHVNLSTWIYIK